MFKTINRLETAKQSVLSGTRGVFQRDRTGRYAIAFTFASRVRSSQIAGYLSSRIQRTRPVRLWYNILFHLDTEKMTIKVLMRQLMNSEGLARIDCGGSTGPDIYLIRSVSHTLLINQAHTVVN